MCPPRGSSSTPPTILALGSQPDLGVQLDAALGLIERENPALKDVLPKVYARAAISPETLGKLVSTIAKIGFGDDPEKASASQRASFGTQKTLTTS